jgi:hypothetical protein
MLYSGLCVQFYVHISAPRSFNFQEALLMKQFIVLIATLLLGLALFSLIAGSEDGSMYSALKQVWSSELAVRTLKGVEP